MQTIDDTNVVTYRSENAAREELVWAAFVVLPNGDYWGVRFNGRTEAEAIDRAIQLWNNEKAKWSKRQPENDPWADVKAEQHHLANKVWMIHSETREKKRVALTEISLYEKNGYVRGGPRSK